jgi:hypothetical protein
VIAEVRRDMEANGRYWYQKQNNNSDSTNTKVKRTKELKL